MSFGIPYELKMLSSAKIIILTEVILIKSMSRFLWLCGGRSLQIYTGHSGIGPKI